MPPTRELPDNPIYAFTPSYEHAEQVQQIRIVFQNMPGYIPTAMVCLTVIDAEDLCDKLNSRLGLDREGWTSLLAQSMEIPHHPSGLH